MSVDPDPAELTTPRDPAEYARPRLMGPGFWAMIAFAVLCIVAGAAIATFGANLFPAKPKPAAQAEPASTPRDAGAPAAAGAETFAAVAPPPEASGGSAELDHLNARIATLEADQARTASSAAAALAAAALLEAAQTSRPFADELTALDAVSPPSAELRALRALAVVGAPSRAALAVDFPEHAARAAGAARAPGEGAGLWVRIQAALSRVVMIRRVGDLPGNGVDAVLARAERQLDDGDIDHALRTLEALPPASRDALSPWTARARTRAEIDRRISAVRAQALEDLARTARGGA
jgi:hypothetical protein